MVHGRGGPEFAILFGRLTENGARFVAHTPNDPATLQDMLTRDQLGREGTVAAAPDGSVNLFTPK